MKKMVICVTYVLLLTGLLHAQKTRTITGTVVDDILSNKWSAIVIQVGNKKYGIQTSRMVSAGDIRSGVKGWEIKTVGNVWDRGRHVQVFYTKVDNTFDSDGVNTWLTATKVVEIKTSLPFGKLPQHDEKQLGSKYSYYLVIDRYAGAVQSEATKNSIIERLNKSGVPASYGNARYPIIDWDSNFKTAPDVDRTKPTLLLGPFPSEDTAVSVVSRLSSLLPPDENYWQLEYLDRQMSARAFKGSRVLGKRWDLGEYQIHGFKIIHSRPLPLVVIGYIDIVSAVGSDCKIRIIAGENTYLGVISFERLSGLTNRRIRNYEEALAIVDGRQIKVTLSGINSSCGNVSPCSFTGVSQLTTLAQNRASQDDQKWKERTTANETIIDLSTDVLFAFNQSTINGKAVPSLIRLARLLRKAQGNSTVQLNGFTDSIGSDEYNVGLSQRRAAAVKQWLVSKGGIDAEWLVTNGFGKAQPVAPNTRPNGSDNPAGRQKNRRVEIRIPRN